MFDVFCVANCQGFNGADLRNVCTEAGMSAIRAERDYVIHEDFMKVSSFSRKQFCSVYQLLYKRITHPCYRTIMLLTSVPGCSKTE